MLKHNLRVLKQLRSMARKLRLRFRLLTTNRISPHQLEEAAMDRMKKMKLLRLAAWTALALASTTVPALSDEPFFTARRPLDGRPDPRVSGQRAEHSGSFQLPASATALGRMERFQAAWLKRLEAIEFKPWTERTNSIIFCCTTRFNDLLATSPSSGNKRGDGPDDRLPRDDP